MYFNLFAVFLVSGLWHGAAMTFIIWGAIHGFIIVLEKAFTKQRKALYSILKIREDSLLRKMVFIPLIFGIVCFAWIFFRANSLSDATLLVSKLNFNNFEHLYNGKIYELGLVKPEFLLALVVIGILTAFEWTHKRVNIQKKLSILVLPLRWTVYIAIVFVILIFGVYGEDQVSEFIYFQF
jgi:hypothetical protein